MTAQNEAHTNPASDNANGAAAARGAAPGLAEVDLEQLAAMLRPLANLTRLRMLCFLARPRYLEEIAGHLGVSRQAARKHVDQLLAGGLIEKQAGRRQSGPVLEYVTNLQSVFMAHDLLSKLGALEGEHVGAHTRTRTATVGKRRTETPSGATLAIVRGMFAGRIFPLAGDEQKEWTLGRDPRCDLVVPYDPWVSGRHAGIRRDGVDYRLLDLRSTNGTSLNWDPLPRGGDVVLTHGDVVEVGRTGLVFWQR